MMSTSSAGAGTVSDESTPLRLLNEPKSRGEIGIEANRRV